MELTTSYHIYNRGAGQLPVFTEPAEFEYFISLLERYLGPQIFINGDNRPFPNYYEDIRLQAFCLIPNHFHLYVEEITPGSVSRLMKSLKVAYCMYFNRRHGRKGVLFESKYHPRQIDDHADHLGIYRYIHLNALAMTKAYPKYPYSSLQYYLFKASPGWLDTTKIWADFDNPKDFFKFHEDHVRQLAQQYFTVLNI